MIIEKQLTIHRMLSKFNIFPLPFHKQANGFELTCGAVSMRARFAHETKLLLIYEMPYQTADCLNNRARACRAVRLSELLGRSMGK